MTAATTGYIRVGSLGLRVRRSGEGPILLINGIGAALEMWEPLVRQLPRHEVITFDMPGCGLSSTSTVPMRMRALVDIVDELLRMVGRSRAHVVGYSYGGLVAQPTSGACTRAGLGGATARDRVGRAARRRPGAYAHRPTTAPITSAGRRW
jgi:surfactin synthase thioesterase subunit